MGRKKILALLAIIFIAGISYAYYLWNKPARTVEDENAITVSAAGLFNDWVKSPSAAKEKYLDKALEVTGTVADFKQNQEGGAVVYFQTDDPIYGVTCSFINNPGSLAKGSTITVKAFCTGYLGDSIETSDVKMDRGILVTK